MVSLRYLRRVRCRAADLVGPAHRCPSAFISGKQDWGTYQRAGALEAMQTRACNNMTLCELVDGAGHWVQQEQPEAVNRLLLRFLNKSTE